MSKDGVMVVPASYGVQSWSQEIYAISSSAHNFAVITGNPTIEEIVSVMSSNHGARIFHWCGHGTNAGLVVSRETIWPVADLLPILRAMKYDMVFINACESEQLGNRIAFESDVPVVIHGANEIPDKVALDVAANIYRQFRAVPYSDNLIEYYNAYVAARPDGGSVLITLGEKFMKQFSPLPRRLSRLEQHRTMLFWLTAGSVLLSIIGLFS